MYLSIPVNQGREGAVERWYWAGLYRAFFPFVRVILRDSLRNDDLAN